MYIKYIPDELSWIYEKLDRHRVKYLDLCNSDKVFTTNPQKRKRILIAVYAYAYEFHDTPMVDDPTYDNLANQIDITVKTGNDKMDHFFEEEYDPSTSLWIYRHPELDKLEDYFHAWEKYSRGIHTETQTLS